MQEREGPKEPDYKVSYTNLYSCNPYLTTYLSQPRKYLGVLILLQVSMVVYFIFTAPAASPLLLVLTCIVYLTSTMVNLLFPFVDPGIIPKILFSYEKQETENIPLDTKYF